MIQIRYKIHLVQALILSMFIVNAYAQTKGMGKPVNGNVPAGTERRLALVIGNKDYPQVGNLKNPVNDAKAMAKALEDLGFEVIQRNNSDYRTFLIAINEFKNKLTSSDVAFFYFSGHGASYDGQNYMLPTDADIDCLEQIEAHGIGLNRILGEIAAKEVKTSFIVLDACRNIPKQLKVCDNSKKDLFTNKGLVKPTNNPKGSLIVYATEEGSTADDNQSSNNALFTEAFLHYLTVPNLSIRNIMDKAATDVERISNGKQSPSSYDKIRGDFYFVVSKDESPHIMKPNNLEVVKPNTKNLKYLDLPFAEMTFIPGGNFIMGDIRTEGGTNETPIHKVILDGFYMGKYEVTQRQWESIMGSNPSQAKGCPDCPVEHVSWENIQEFLMKLNVRTLSNYRLPTEAEWEYAAGGGTSNRRRFGNGQDILTSSEANFDASATYVKPYSTAGEYRAKAVRVGSFAPNELGLYDMTGNVMEWCEDWFENYSSNTVTNPRGPATGGHRVLRGGSWINNSQNCRITSRDSAEPNNMNINIGFRIVIPK